MSEQGIAEKTPTTPSGEQVGQHRLVSCLPGFEGAVYPESDAVFTPDWAAKDMVDWFKPTGRMLEPCKGGGAILRHMPGADWCEIAEGKNFYDWHTPVDWIVSNPPYSHFRDWLNHSYKIADNIVYLVPLMKLFSAAGQLDECRKQGWMRHIRLYGGGGKLNFPMGNAVGAIHFESGWNGETTWSHFFS
jgi:hypothetical protein